MAAAAPPAALRAARGRGPAAGNHSAASAVGSTPRVPNADRRLHHNDAARHSSARLGYSDPGGVGAPIIAWFNTVVPRESGEDTFFATNGHNFGYMGLQQVEERGTWFQGAAIFSMWDAGCAGATCPEAQRAEVIECGMDVVCTRFDGEGTGARTRMRFDQWQLQQPYSFMVQAFLTAPDKVRYDGYLHAGELGGWVLLSKIQVHFAAEEQWYIRGMYSFVEQWSLRGGGAVRLGTLGRTFVEVEGAPDKWRQLTEAVFTHSAGPNEDATHIRAEVTNGGLQWDLGIGGDLQSGIREQDRLRVAESPGLPAELTLFGQLRQAGQLPTGCSGGTCSETLVKHWYQEAISKTYAPITGIIIFVVACVPCVCLCVACRWWRRRRHAQGARQAAMGPPRPGAGGEAGVQGVHWHGRGNAKNQPQPAQIPPARR